MVNLDDIKQMLAEADEHTLTLYLNVNNADEDNQSTRPLWRIWLKERLHELSEQNREQGREARQRWEQIQTRVDAFFNDYQADSKSLALFTGTSFQQSLELEVPLENQYYYGKPAVMPLLWALDEYEPYLIALVDQEKARFLVAQLGSVDFEDAIEIDLDEYDFREKTLMPPTAAVVGGHGLTQGSHRDIFEDTLQEHRNRFYRETVEQLQKLADQHNAERIILGGAEESAHAVKSFMPETLAERVVGILPIPMRSTPKQVIDLAIAPALDYEREQEMVMVNEVIDFAKSGGRGALGLEAVEAALDMQQVEMLLMPYPMDDSSLAAELPLRAFVSASKIELVHGEVADRLKEEGGIAARLYYAL